MRMKKQSFFPWLKNQRNVLSCLRLASKKEFLRFISKISTSTQYASLSGGIPKNPRLGPLENIEMSCMSNLESTTQKSYLCGVDIKFRAQKRKLEGRGCLFPTLKAKG